MELSLLISTHPDSELEFLQHPKGNRSVPRDESKRVFGNHRSCQVHYALLWLLGCERRKNILIDNIARLVLFSQDIATTVD